MMMMVVLVMVVLSNYGASDGPSDGCPSDGGARGGDNSDRQRGSFDSTNLR